MARSRSPGWYPCVAMLAALAGCMTDRPSYRMAAPQPSATQVEGVAHAVLGAPEEVPPPVKVLPPLEASTFQGEVLALENLLELAEQANPELAIARARAEAARGRLVQAGLYPNPTFTWVGSQILAHRNAGGEEGPLFMQQIVTARKLHIATQAAAHGVKAAEWQAQTRWFDVVTRVRIAYADVLTTRQEVAVSGRLVRLAEEGLEAARKLQRLGAGTEPDVLQARVEWNQGRQRHAVAQAREAAAWKLLATAVGVNELPPGNLAGQPATPLALDWQAVHEATMTRSSEIQEAQANLLQAQEVYRLQVAERVPDLRLGVRPFYSFPDQDKRLYVEIGANLPLFNRNQGNIQAAAADLARVTQEVRLVELKLTGRLTSAFQRYRVALEQSESYQKEILPDAAESLRLIRLGYERGDPKYDFTMLLQAQRTLAQAQLAHVQALGEVWRATYEVLGLWQGNGGSFGSAGPPVP